MENLTFSRLEFRQLPLYLRNSCFCLLANSLARLLQPLPEKSTNVLSIGKKPLWSYSALLRGFKTSHPDAGEFTKLSIGWLSHSTRPPNYRPLQCTQRTRISTRFKSSGPIEGFSSIISAYNDAKATSAPPPRHLIALHRHLYKSTSLDKVCNSASLNRWQFLSSLIGKVKKKDYFVNTTA